DARRHVRRPRRGQPCRPPHPGAAPRAAPRARAGGDRARLPLRGADRAVQLDPPARRAGDRRTRLRWARAPAGGPAHRLRHPRHPRDRGAAGGAALGGGAPPAARVRADGARVHLPRPARAARGGARREPPRDGEPLLRGGDHPEEPRQAAHRGGAGVPLDRLRPHPAHVLPPVLLALRRSPPHGPRRDPLDHRAPRADHEPRRVQVQVPRRALAAGARALHRALPLRTAVAPPARADGRRGGQLRGRAPDAFPRARAAVALHRPLQDRDHRRAPRPRQPARDQPPDLPRPVRRLRAGDRDRARRRGEARALAQHHLRRAHLGGEGRPRERPPARGRRGHRAARRARRERATAARRPRRGGPCRLVPLPGLGAPRAARRLARGAPGRVRGDHRHRGGRGVDAAARPHRAPSLLRGGAGLRRHLGARRLARRRARLDRARPLRARAVRRDDRGERLARPPARDHRRRDRRARPRAALRRRADAPRGPPHAGRRGDQAPLERRAQDRARARPRRPPAPRRVRGVLPPPRPGVQADGRAAPQGPGRGVERARRVARPGVPRRVRPHLRPQGRPRLERGHVRRAARRPVLPRRRAGAARSPRRRHHPARRSRVV
ncbi:MAG: HlyB/MsbA family ABC transporter, partial [uncultured Gemmatimonadaceae bacterium]